MSAVGLEYRHATKTIRPGHTIVAGDAVLKWYDIALAADAVPPEIQVLARGTLLAAVDGEAIDVGDDDLGFVILHRCGEAFFFLLVSTWRNENELWQSVWAKGEDDVTFRPWLLTGTHRPTFCVWELGAVWHEQQAWSRYLRSARDDDAREAYLRDSFTGDV
jgi:hypothetical protein